MRIKLVFTSEVLHVLNYFAFGGLFHKNCVLSLSTVGNTFNNEKASLIRIYVRTKLCMVPFCILKFEMAHMGRKKLH